MPQLCFRGLRPRRPTIRTWRVAEKIAQRIVGALSAEKDYWKDDELLDRIADVANEIARVGRPATVFRRLSKLPAPTGEAGLKDTDPYGWDGLDEHCRLIAPQIAAEELALAVRDYERNYGEDRP